MALARLMTSPGEGYPAISKSLVLCTNMDRGCDWQGGINDVTGHLGKSDGCQFEEVECSNDCGLWLQRQNLSNHVDYECPCREVHCQYCSVVGQYDFIMNEHADQCIEALLPSNSSCGVDSILRKDMPEDQKTTYPFEEMKCPNDCGEALQEQFMTNHVETECPCREVECQYCQLPGEYQFIEGKHKEECLYLPINCPNECEVGRSIPYEEMTAHRLQCPLEVIECEYYSIGCKDTMARKDQCEHDKEKMEEHLYLTSNKLTECQTKITELESELIQNRALLKLMFGDWDMQLNMRALQSSTGDQVLPVIIRMPDYSSNKNWCSDPFYTQEIGYKIHLKVAGYSENTYLSVSLCLTKGPYDDELSWPMTGRFQVRLLNQTSDNSHHSRTSNVYNPDELASIDSTKEIWCDPHFIRITSIVPSQYLKNDSLIFEVLNIENTSEC